KPISKLTILFLFFIFIPGLILSYFSIQNIGNQKELTEKRLHEQQNQLAALLAGNFQQQLEQYTTEFFYLADSLQNKRNNQITVPDSLKFVDIAFVVNKDGKFIRPYLLPESPAIQTHPKSASYLKIFSKAEQQEFSKSDLRAAAGTYKKTIKAAGSSHEKATAINGLARVLFKRKLYDQARVQYKILAEQFGDEIDQTGTPFAYYSLHQLNRMNLISPNEQTEKNIKSILVNLNEDKIPLTNHIELHLKELKDTILNPDQINQKLKSDVTRLINAIDNKILFANREANLITQYLSGALIQPSLPVAKNFIGITGKFEDKPVLLILNSAPVSGRIVGFKTDLNFVKKKVLNDISNLKTEFELEIQIVTKKQLNQTESNEFTLIRDLSSLVPAWQILVKPKNLDILNQYITTRRWIYSITLILLIFGMFLGIILVFRDMSREKRLGQLRSDFVSNVTHELKTPLTSIRMFAETMLLGRIKKKKEQQEYLSIIVNESARLTRLINNVLDFSKIEKNKKEYHFELINLSEVIQSAINSMAYWLEEQGFKIEVKIESDIKTKADGDAIEQAVLNLLSNAMKYSFKRKEINLEVWTENQSINIQVRDKGIGVAESQQKHIFDKYYRAHSGHQGDKGGAGLGLTVIKHIVEAHQGTIKLKSQVNRGSTFTIVLPVISN
ncbi:ATP-binding protein, partial [Calditrichota bacterium]